MIDQTCIETHAEELLERLWPDLDRDSLFENFVGALAADIRAALERADRDLKTSDL